MKKILILIIMFIISLVGINFSETFNLSGNNYILMEESSARILVENNAYDEMPMASTTKIMTALLAIELGDLEEYVDITEDSIGVIGSSIYLEKGEKIKLKDLIYGLMLRSGNDASVAIAIHISGTVDEFVREMNSRVKEIGANNTNFENPHGLHDKNHYSTAYDMALITREALLNQEFSTIWASKSYTSERSKNNHFVNKNKTLWEYDGGDGGKTGYTSNSGRCLVSTAIRDNMRLIAVNLNASDWFNDNYKLFNHGFENYNLYTLYSKGQLLKKIAIENGSKGDLILVSENNLEYPLREEEINGIKLTMDINKQISLPISIGDRYGYVKTYLEGQVIRNDQLIAKYEIDKKPFFQKIIELIRNKV